MDEASVRAAPGFAITYKNGNMFDAAEDRAVLVHAVNCQGVWGMGIAYQLKKRLPQAFAVYETKCKAAGAHLVGTCFLIPPQPADYEVADKPKVVFSTRLWVACLFTSKGYGKKNNAKKNPGKDTPEVILAQTKLALEDFRLQLESYGPSNFNAEETWKTDDEKPGKLLAVKFNSGAFGVPWERTAALIDEMFSGFERPLQIFDGNVVPQPKHSSMKNKDSPWVLPEPDDE